jgi:CRP-like cAMP-binding protein
MKNGETLLAEDLPSPPAPSYISTMAKSYMAGDVLFIEGETGREMFIVLKGCVRIACTSGEGDVALGEFHEGDFFGEMALVGSGLRTGTATVHADATQLVAVNQGRFVYLVSQQPAFALSIMRLMGRRMEAMNLRLSNLEMQIA